MPSHGDVFFAHIRNEIPDILPVGEPFQILMDMGLHAVRKDIKDSFLLPSRQDALKFLSARVAPKLINREDFRQFQGLPVFCQIHPPTYGGLRDPELPGNILAGYFL